MWNCGETRLRMYDWFDEERKRAIEDQDRAHKIYTERLTRVKQEII